MNVSERSVYMARAVARLNPDLAQQVRDGNMTINTAYVLATGKTKPAGIVSSALAFSSNRADPVPAIGLRLRAIYHPSP
jgi:hypothetical protein